MKKLTGKQASYLRSLAHKLKPVLQIGKEGVNEPFLKEVAAALKAHELIKIKLLRYSPENITEAADMITEKADCYLAQTIGKTMLLYRERDEKPSIVLPKK